MRQLRYLIQVFQQKILQSRMYTLLLLQTYVLYIYIKPVVRFAKEADYPSAPWILPFLFSNIYFLFLFMLGVIYCFSDVPFMQHSNMYQIIRTGRKQWALGQIGSVILQAGFLMLFNLTASILMFAGHCEFQPEWGKLLHTAALTNAADYYNFLFELPYSAMQKYSPVELMTLTFLIGTLVISFIGLLMFVLSLFLNRIWAVAVAGVMVIMVYFVHNAYPFAAQQISMFVPVSWMRTVYIGIKLYNYYTIPSLGYILTVLSTGIILLSVMILWAVNRVEFVFYKED